MKKPGEPAAKRLANYGFDPVTFYQYVKAQVEEEVDQANAELRKQKLPLIERVFMPSFQGKLSLTFGIGFLCTVELLEAKGRIRAVIFGPPNRDEIARKDYFLSSEAVDLQDSPIEEVQKIAVGFSPHRIAAEIVSGLLMGEFA
ncbi:MAG: hypothetical protein ACLQDA_01715 [Terracidiphilus sp.]